MPRQSRSAGPSCPGGGGGGGGHGEADVVSQAVSDRAASRATHGRRYRRGIRLPGNATPPKGQPEGSPSSGP